MSQVPVYIRIREDLQARIRSGDLKPGDRIPSEAEIGDDYGVTRMTVRQALESLRNAGLVTKRRGVGTFVAERSGRYRRLNRLVSFDEEIGIHGQRVETRILERGTTTDVPADIRAALQLKRRAKAIRLLRLRYVNDNPVSLQESWLRYALLPSLAREPLVGGSLYRTLTQRGDIRLGWAEQDLTASSATAEQSEWLNVAEGTPLISIQRTTFDDFDHPLEYARSWTRPEYPLAVRLMSAPESGA